MDLYEGSATFVSQEWERQTFHADDAFLICRDAVWAWDSQCRVKKVRDFPPGLRVVRFTACRGLRTDRNDRRASLPSPDFIVCPDSQSSGSGTSSAIPDAKSRAAGDVLPKRTVQVAVCFIPI